MSEATWDLLLEREQIPCDSDRLVGEVLGET